MSKTSWSFYQVWNESLENREEREIKPRSNMWASELGKSYVDRYLKMTGVAPTNPPNPRSLRKFEAGNIWEWIVGLVLRRAGILLESQGWVSFKYPGLLEVTGKLDYLAGGKPDWEKAQAEISSEHFPEFLGRAAQAIVKHFQSKYPSGMREGVLEIKTAAAFMFDLREKFGAAETSHALQAFHYLKAKDLPEAHVVYICKDDARMLELGVFNPSPIEDIYRQDIEKMTNYLEAKEQPPLEPLIDYDPDTTRFMANWKVGYSPYLTKLYGFKNQMEFEDKYKPVVMQWNRVVNRVVKGERMTTHNLGVIADIKKTYPDFDQMMARARATNEEEK